MRQLFLLVLFVAALLGGSFERAEAAGKGGIQRNVTAKNATLGRQLLNTGMAAIEAKDFKAAADALSESYRLAPRPEALYHLGRVAIAEGRTLEAHDLLRRYMSDPSREPDEAAAEVADKFLSQPPPPNGSVAVLSDPGALVFVDGHVVGTLPLPLPLLLSPGAHTVSLEFLNKKLEAPVQTEAGRLTELRISHASGAVLMSVLPAILFFSEQPGLPADTLRTLVDSLEQAARGEQYTLLRADLALSAAPELKDCLQKESCKRQLAQKSKVDLLLLQSIESTGDAKAPKFKVELKLLRADIVVPAGETEVRCGPCTVEQAASRVKDAAAKLFADGILRPFGTVKITTVPETATLRIGARVAWNNESLWVGNYELTVSNVGYKTETRFIRVTDGQTNELKISLTPIVAPKPPPEALPPPSAPPKLVWERAPRPVWRMLVGGAMIGLGMGLIAAGGVGVARDGTCVDTPTVDGGACQRLYTTGPPGGASIGVGAAVLIGGVVVMALPGRLRQVPAR